MQDERILPLNKNLFNNVKKESIHDFYEIEEKELGKGGFGTVYRGRVQGTEGPWRAIKMIPAENIKDMKALLNEVEISVDLDNPNVVRLYEIYENNKNVYLVTDLCEGGELFDRLEQQGGLTEASARTLFIQMVEAVNYLHKKKIAHRDLKPENFLFLRKDSENIKLIDFGLSVRWEESLTRELKKRREKKIIGTSYYMAPEILSFEYDERCDIWSLGVILYILLSAVPPFDGEGEKAILRSVRNMQYSFKIPQFEGISQEAKDLISEMLQPVHDRITMKQIFAHPWMHTDIPVSNHKVDFSKMKQYSQFNKLKKATANYVASQMSEKDVEKLGQLFRKIDVDHDGFIQMQELKQVLASEQTDIDLKDLKSLMDSIDTDGNGKINYTEFLASSLTQEELFAPSNLLKLFRLLDKDGNGEIDKTELSALFEENGVDGVNGHTFEEIMQLCDKDKSGSIDFEEFKAAILQ